MSAYAVQKSHLVMQHHQESVRQAHEAGIKIAMGTDCGTPFKVASKDALELELLTQNGLSAAEALLATIRVIAEVIGLQALAGTWEPGKWADIILVQGNPLDDMRVLQLESVSARWLMPLRCLGRSRWR
jgi:imidazolonepropionase-like amidohydrolase